MLLLAVFLAMISARSAEETKNHTKLVICGGIIFNGTYYDRKTVYKGSGRSLFMHEPSGDLFFSHTVRLETTSDSQLVACHVLTRSCRIIPGIRGGFTVGYDRMKDQIYFGGIDGIYIYNNVTDAAEYYAEEGNSIWGIFILHNFLYIEYPSQHLYIRKANKFVLSRLQAEVLTFYADETRFFYSNRTGLYTQSKKKDAQPVVLSTAIVVRQITEDKTGNIYFCAENGIYIENKADTSVKELAFISGAYGMTFMNLYESDVLIVTLIYSDENNVYRLLPSKHSDICYTAVLDALDHSENKLRQTPSKVYLNIKFDFL